jgi:hypothetical protein
MFIEPTGGLEIELFARFGRRDIAGLFFLSGFLLTHFSSSGNAATTRGEVSNALCSIRVFTAAFSDLVFGVSLFKFIFNYYKLLKEVFLKQTDLVVIKNPFFLLILIIIIPALS